MNSRKYTTKSFVDYYKNTIDGMQNEMDFFGRYKKFVYNHDFEKIDDALLEYVVLLF